eukprot:CAMPEP_0194422834 /NCGR_PEP_ID=MMETSP0176-20130528/22158_1 /TAXON_ID=216777 /ORGANISM="Proboscia alata, Strain PI-D3" /LENGTH=128 /DNA_ID=CAMNT_0039231797 /DNA_START=65 /DNA_END=447 /DNA_ORIENTATION=+
MSHPENLDEQEIISIPMVEQRKLGNGPGTELFGDFGRHIIFVLDQSGSMAHDWGGVVNAYNQYLSRRRENQSDSDLVSVVQFDHCAVVSVNKQPLAMSPTNLNFGGGGTSFLPAASCACQIVRDSKSG